MFITLVTTTKPFIFTRFTTTTKPIISTTLTTTTKAVMFTTLSTATKSDIFTTITTTSRFFKSDYALWRDGGLCLWHLLVLDRCNWLQHLLERFLQQRWGKSKVTYISAHRIYIISILNEIFVLKWRKRKDGGNSRPKELLGRTQPAFTVSATLQSSTSIIIRLSILTRSHRDVITAAANYCFRLRPFLSVEYISTLSSSKQNVCHPTCTGSFLHDQNVLTSSFKRSNSQASLHQLTRPMFVINSRYIEFLCSGVVQHVDDNYASSERTYHNVVLVILESYDVIRDAVRFFYWTTVMTSFVMLFYF